MSLLEHDLSVWVAALSSWTPELRGGRGICRACLESPFTLAARFERTDPHELVHRLVVAASTVADTLVAEYEEGYRRETDPNDYLDEPAVRSDARWDIFRRHAQTLVSRELVAAQALIRLALDVEVEDRVAAFAHISMADADGWR